MSKDKAGDSFNSGGGNMNVAKDKGIAIQHNYGGSTAPQSDSAPSVPAETVFEEIEYLLAQNKVLDAIERLRTLPEQRREAIGLSRRWHAIQDKQRKQLLTDEQAETELNKIVDAMLEICGGAQSSVASNQSAVSSRQLAEGSSQFATPSVHQSERDYFENVGGNVYTGPVTIHQHGRESAAAKPPSETTDTASRPKNALSRALRGGATQVMLCS